MKNARDEIELLTYLFEKWDEEHEALSPANLIELLTSLMSERSIRTKDLVEF